MARCTNPDALASSMNGFPGGATWMQRRPARSIARCIKSDALASSMKKGHALVQGLEEPGRPLRRGPMMGLHDIPARDDIAAVKCLSTTPGRWRTSKVSSCTKSRAVAA